MVVVTKAGFSRRKGVRPVVWLLWVYFGGCGVGLECRGDLLRLLKRRRSVPFGVILDRLQEFPEEVRGTSAKTVAAAVEWMRRNNPNGGLVGSDLCY